MGGKVEYTWLERGLFEERQEAEDVLAKALGYHYDENYGYATGEHTLVTLAMEAARKLGAGEDTGMLKFTPLTKFCYGCGERKFVCNFLNNPDNDDGLMNLCTNCGPSGTCGRCGSSRSTTTPRCARVIS